MGSNNSSSQLSIAQRVGFTRRQQFEYYFNSMIDFSTLYDPLCSIIADYAVEGGFDLITAHCIREYPCFKASVVVGLNSSQIVVIGSNDGDLRFIDCFDGEDFILSRAHSCRICCILEIFLNSRFFILTGSIDGIIKLWCLEKGVQVSFFRTLNSILCDICFSNSSGIVLCAASNGSIDLIDLETGAVSCVLGNVYSFLSRVISLSDDCFLSFGSDNTRFCNRISIWNRDFSSKSEFDEIIPFCNVIKLPSENICCAHLNGSLSTWNPSTRTLIMQSQAIADHNISPCCLSVIRDLSGEWFIASADKSKKIYIWSQELKLVRAIDFDRSIDYTTLSFNDWLVVLSNETKSIFCLGN